MSIDKTPAMRRRPLVFRFLTAKLEKVIISVFIFRVLSCFLKNAIERIQSEMCAILIGLVNTQHMFSAGKRLLITLGKRDRAADNRTRMMLFSSFFGVKTKSPCFDLFNY